MSHIKGSKFDNQGIAWGTEKKSGDFSYVLFFAPAKLIAVNRSFKSPASCVIFYRYVNEYPRSSTGKTWGTYCEEDDRPITPGRLESVLSGFTIRK